MRGVWRLSWLLWFCAAVAPCARAQRWSPDGEWIGYRLESSARAGNAVDMLHWLVGEAAPARPLADGARTPTRRLWATRVTDHESILIEETAGDLTEPSWTRQSPGVYFARIQTGEGGRRRLELVVRESAARERVLAARDVAAEAFRRTERGDALWSPDGAHVVAPLVEPAGLWIVRLADGKTVHELKNASRAAWSPEGLRLAFVEETTAPGLCVLDLRTSDVRRLTEFKEATPIPPPIWSRDGQLLLYVSATGSRVQGGSSTDQALRLARLRLEPLRPEGAFDLNEGPKLKENALRSCAVVLDVDETSVFETAEYATQASTLNWIRIANGEVRKRFNPFHETVSIRSLGISPLPGAPLLSMRVALGDDESPPALCDPAAESFVPLVPDESARDAWLRLIVDAISDVLGRLAEEESPEAWYESHPTRLPYPDQLGEGAEAKRRLLRLAALGRMVDDAATSSSADEAAGHGSRLLFDYLLGDFGSVLGELDAYEGHTADPHARLRLVGLRAQVLAGLGRRDAAGVIVDYLRARSDADRMDVEEVPGMGGWVVSEEPSASPTSWVGSLADALAGTTEGEAESGLASAITPGAGMGLEQAMPFEAGNAGIPPPPAPGDVGAPSRLRRVVRPAE